MNKVLFLLLAAAVMCVAGCGFAVVNEGDEGGTSIRTYGMEKEEVELILDGGEQE